MSSNKCARCLTIAATSRCGGCRKVYYCNKQCQTSHWQKHKSLCKYYRTKNNNEHSLFAAKNRKIKQSHIKRIDEVLNIYSKSIQNAKKTNDNDLFSVISKLFPNEKVNYFIADYIKYVLDENIPFHKNIDQCDLEKCNYIQRIFRDKNKYDNNLENRTNLYHQCTSDRSIVICQMLDQLHCHKYHLTDLGLRSVHPNKNIKQIVCDLQYKNKKLRSLGGTNRWSKFVTHINTKSVTNTTNETKKEEKEKETENSEYLTYSPGVRYYYHSYFKNNTDTNMILLGIYPEDGNMDIDGGRNYTYSSWYIHPKYKSMKEEVLHGSLKISLFQFKNTQIKAKWKHDTNKHNVLGANPKWEHVYDVSAGSIITVKHIISLLLYCNFTELSAAFSATFRRLSATESDKSLKQRHSVYAQWGRYLRETVECFGTTLTYSRIAKFYHGITQCMVFKGVRERFCGPCSTTLNYETAVMFASQETGNGIVVTIQNDKTAGQYFDCRAWSDFPGENEMLFLAGFQPLNICGLTSIIDGVEYDKWILAIKIFEYVRHGSPSCDKVTTDNVHLIEALINNYMEKKETNEKIPKYVDRLFKHIVEDMLVIAIDTVLFNKSFFYADSGIQFYGFKLLKHLYFKPNGEIKWNYIGQLFPNVDCIQIQAVDYFGTDIHRFVPTIKITTKVMNDMVFALQDDSNALKNITLNYPKNDQKSLTKFKHQYNMKFGKSGLRFGIEAVNDETYGTCNAFFVNTNILMYELST